MLDAISSKKRKNSSSLPVNGASSSAACADTQAGGKAKPKTGKQGPQHPIEEMLGETIVHSNGDVVSPKTFVVEGGIIGLYFAAHWCPPCKLLSPQLALLYQMLRESGKRFEVVYISLDYNEESFNQYFSKMLWHAIRYSDIDKREEIVEKFGVRGIPALIVIDAQSCGIITPHGREMIFIDPMGEFFPWSIEKLVEARAKLALQEKPDTPSGSQERRNSKGSKRTPSERSEKNTEKWPPVDNRKPSVDNGKESR